MLNTKETAIIDGINIFVRTVLRAKGLISQEAFDEVGSREVLDLKYQIARDLARAWAKHPMQE